MAEKKNHNTLQPFIKVLEAGDGIGHLNLTLVPLRGEGHGQLNYILASDALAMGQLTVTEVSEAGSVPELMVTSTTDSSILLLDGEELVGAKQNRILNTTILLPGRAKTKIPVSCVEQGRWRHVSNNFSSGGYAPARLRARKSHDVTENLREYSRADSDQGAVWDEVHSCLQAAQTSSATMALNDAVKERKDSLDSYIGALGYPSGARGVVAAINGKFAVMDLFDKPETLEKVWPRLVSGYVLDALVCTGDPTVTFTAKGARSLLEHVGELECCSYPSVGLGADWRFQAPDIVGQALVVQDICVQLSIFPNAEENRDGNPEFRIMSPSYRRGHRGHIY